MNLIQSVGKTTFDFAHMLTFSHGLKYNLRLAPGFWAACKENIGLSMPYSCLVKFELVPCFVEEFSDLECNIARKLYQVRSTSYLLHTYT